MPRAETRRFHLLARGVVVRDRGLLIAHFQGADHTFLPGGHVEMGESVPSALRREFTEELRIEVRIGRYLGAIEHGWTTEDTQHFEINHCFEVMVPSAWGTTPPASYARNLEFLWAPVHDLKAHNLQPVLLWTLVPRWVDGDRSPWWGSTLPT
ncbi:MAG TPA: NUDIX domain-containing protein [bacterium]|nr:NUDIX domain-containing protein [bacterium]